MKSEIAQIDAQVRREALLKCASLETESDKSFDAMARLASYICQAPIATICIVDGPQHWFKAIVGLDIRFAALETTLCGKTMEAGAVCLVADTLEDPEFQNDPWVLMHPPGIRFYAGVPLITADGACIGVLSVMDTTPRQLSETQLNAIKTLADNVVEHLGLLVSHTQAKYRIDNLELAASIFNAASEAMFVSDADNNILMVNPAFTAITGFTQDEVVGNNPRILSSGRQPYEFYQKMWRALRETGRWSGELWNRKKDGEIYAQQLSINVIYRKSGDRGLHIAIFSDITYRKQAEEQVWHQANYDHLTQLPNRLLFHNRIEQEIKSSRRTGQQVALLFIDLDRFKAINDNLGHSAGDELLRQSAVRIQQCVRESDTVARLGGDEFTVLLLHLQDPAVAEKIAKNIIAGLELPFSLGGQDVTISASIGIAIFPRDGEGPEQMLRRADIAMYSAKKSGKGRYCLYSATLT